MQLNTSGNIDLGMTDFKLEFRHFNRETELVQRMDLFRICFPETRGRPEQTLDYYNWKYGCELYQGKRYEYGAYIGLKLVGYYAALEVPYRIGKNVHKAALVFDVMTDPEIRGKGVFSQLGKYAVTELTKEGMDLGITFPIRKAVMPGFIKAEWEIVQNLPMYISILDVREFLPPAFKCAAAIYKEVFKTIANLRYGRFSQNTPDLRCKPIARGRAGDQVNISWEKGINGIAVSSRFLDWRLSNPISEYYQLDLKQGSNWKTIAILAHSEVRGKDSLAIIYLERSRSYKGSDLFRKIYKLAFELGVSCVISMNSKSQSRQHRFTSNMMIKSPYLFKCITRPLKERIPTSVFQMENNWNLMWIDTDDL